MYINISVLRTRYVLFIALHWAAMGMINLFTMFIGVISVRFSKFSFIDIYKLNFRYSDNQYTLSKI